MDGDGDGTRRWWRAAAVAPFVLALRAYQVVLAPLMSGHCRFIPTCSNYAIEAYKTHGVIRGTWLTARRLARCQPWGGNGYDPVPPRRQRHKHGDAATANVGANFRDGWDAAGECGDGDDGDGGGD